MAPGKAHQHAKLTHNEACVDQVILVADVNSRGSWRIIRNVIHHFWTKEVTWIPSDHI